MFVSVFFFFKQKTAYEMRISDWSSDVCSSDLDEKQMPDLSRILSAKQPLTLSGTPAGCLPWLLADLARAADKRAIFIAADEVDMRAVAATAAWFAPELDVFSYPAWACLPYDRASPTLRVMAARLAALHRLQQPSRAPHLQVPPPNAVDRNSVRAGNKV